MKSRRITDERALDGIQAILDGQEWTIDDLDSIAEIVRNTGREVRDANDESKEDSE